MLKRMAAAGLMFALLIAMATLLGCSRPAAGPAVTTASATKPALDITLSTETTELFVGEPILLQVRVTNRSDQPVVVQSDWFGIPFPTLTLRISRGSHTTEDQPFSSDLDYSGQRAVTLGQGENLYRLVRLSLVELPTAEAAEVTFQAAFASEDKYSPVFGGPTDRACWGGTIESNRLTVKVKPLENDFDMAALKLVSGDKPKAGLFAYEKESGVYWPHVWDCRYDPARKLLMEQVVKKYPAGLFAPYAQLALMEEKSYRDGHNTIRVEIEPFQKAYHSSHLTAEAELRLANWYLSEHHKAEAVAHSEHILKAYPKSASVERARQILALAESWTLGQRDLFEDLAALRSVGQTAGRHMLPGDASDVEDADPHRKLGPVMQADLYAYGSGRPCAVNFETGQCYAIPPTSGTDAQKALAEWLARTGVDAVCRIDLEEEGEKEVRLEGFGLSLDQIISLGRGDRGENDVEAWLATPVGKQAARWVTSDRYESWSFKTADGRFGIASVAEIATWEKPWRVRLQWQLLEQ